MMSKIGVGELVLILGVALLFFGPSKLPELGKAVGKSIREFKGAMTGAEAAPESDQPAPSK